MSHKHTDIKNTNVFIITVFCVFKYATIYACLAVYSILYYTTINSIRNIYVIIDVVWLWCILYGKAIYGTGSGGFLRGIFPRNFVQHAMQYHNICTVVETLLTIGGVITTLCFYTVLTHRYHGVEGVSAV